MTLQQIEDALELVPQMDACLRNDGDFCIEEIERYQTALSVLKRAAEAHMEALKARRGPGYLLHLRAQRGLTLREVAEGTGISNAYISRLERGGFKNPSLKNIIALAKFFKVPIEEFADNYTNDE